MDEKTHYAKQLFIYGEGGNAPIKSIQKLAKKAGIGERTIHTHVKAWRKESAELAINHQDSPFSLSLSEEALACHRAMVETLGGAVEKLRKRLEGMSAKQESYPHVLAAYQSAMAKWEKSAGIEAHFKAAEAGMRERVKVTEREREKKRLNGLGDKPAPRQINTKHFER